MAEQPVARSTDLIALGRVIKRHREDRQLTLGQLSVEAGVSRRTLINAESGAHAIGVDRLMQIAAALGTRASAMLAEAEIDLGGAEEA